MVEQLPASVALQNVIELALDKKQDGIDEQWQLVSRSTSQSDRDLSSMPDDMKAFEENTIKWTKEESSYSGRVVEGTKSLYFPTGAHANQLIKPVMGGADHGVIMLGGGLVDDEIIFSLSSVNHVDRTMVSDWNEEDGNGLHDAGRTGKVDDSESAIMLWDPGITSS